MKKHFKLNNKIILYWMTFNLTIFIYNIVRLLFVTNVDNLFAMSEGVVYIQMIREILTIALISPSIFLYNKHSKNVNESYLSMFIFGGITSFILILMNLVSMPFITNSMMKINPDANVGDIHTFLITSMVGSIATLFMYIYVSIFTFEKKYNSILILMIVQMFAFISIDVIFLSSLFFDKQTIISVSISNILAPTLAALIGLILVWKSNRMSFKNYNFKNLLNAKNKGYLLQTFYITLEGVLRQLVYVFITLAIMSNLGSEEWSSWNLSMNIFFGVFLGLASAIQMSCYNGYANTKDSNEILKSSFIYITVAATILLLISYPLFEIFMPWNANHASFVPKAIKTSWYLLLPIILLMYIQMFIPYFNSNGKSKYYLYTQLFQLPLNITIFVLLKTGVIVGNYKISASMFAIGIILVLLVYLVCWIYDNKKEAKRLKNRDILEIGQLMYIHDSRLGIEYDGVENKKNRPWIIIKITKQTYVLTSLTSKPFYDKKNNGEYKKLKFGSYIRSDANLVEKNKDFIKMFTKGEMLKRTDIKTIKKIIKKHDNLNQINK